MMILRTYGISLGMKFERECVTTRTADLTAFCESHKSHRRRVYRSHVKRSNANSNRQKRDATSIAPLCSMVII